MDLPLISITETASIAKSFPEQAELHFHCPDNCKKLFFIVSGAPTEHWHHPWDDNDANDEQWPYKVKFTGVSVTGL
jgi:hypothetical protein